MRRIKHPGQERTQDCLKRNTQVVNVPKKLPKVKNKIKETTPMRVTPPIAIANQPRVREGKLFAVITPPTYATCPIALPLAVQRNLQGITPASRILGGESGLSLSTQVPRRGVLG